MLVLGAVLVVAVAGVFVVRGSGSDDGSDGDGGRNGEGGGAEQAGDGWVSEAHGNSLGLVTTGGQVCATTVTAGLYCLDAATGEPRFDQEVGSSVTSPALVDDTLLVGTTEGSGPSATSALHAFSLDGEELWSAPLDVSDDQQLPVIDGVVGVADGRVNGELVGIDVASGEERWRTFSGDPLEVPQVTGTVFADGERFYAGLQVIDEDNPQPGAAVAAIDPATGQELWRTDLGPELTSFLGIEDLAASEDGSTVTLIGRGADTPNHLVVLDTATGEIVRQETLTSNYGSLLPVDASMLVADGASLVAQGADGQELWAVPAPSASGDEMSDPGELVEEGGRVYLAGYDVFEVDPADGATALVAEGVSAMDVAVVDGLLVIAGISQLEARSLDG